LRDIFLRSTRLSTLRRSPLEPRALMSVGVGVIASVAAPDADTVRMADRGLAPLLRYVDEEGRPVRQDSRLVQTKGSSQAPGGDAAVDAESWAADMLARITLLRGYVVEVLRGGAPVLRASWRRPCASRFVAALLLEHNAPCCVRWPYSERNPAMTSKERTGTRGLPRVLGALFDRRDVAAGHNATSRARRAPGFFLSSAPHRPRTVPHSSYLHACWEVLMQLGGARERWRVRSSAWHWALPAASATKPPPQPPAAARLRMR